MALHDYDLVAIGSGPAGRAAALQAAALGKRAAVVERGPAPGGAPGVLPSKILRAAIVELTGRADSVYGTAFRLRHELTVDDLLWRAQHVIDREHEAVHDELRRSGVELVEGAASFVGPQTLEVRRRRLRAARIVIAVGTRPARPAGIDFDGRTVLEADGILGLGRLPRTLSVVGGGIAGVEYASMAAALGIHVTLVEPRARLLGFVDDDLAEELQYHLSGVGVGFRLGEEVETVRRLASGDVVTRLRGGEELWSEAVVHAGGREGATDGLNLAAAGLAPDERGMVPAGPDGRTAQPHVFAAGDVTGASCLAAAAGEQGRRAALAAFDREAPPALVPYAIHSIPELSSVGAGERALRRAGIPYVAGVARYRELVRAEIAGERSGLLKLLVHAGTRELLGVHVLGTGATELVHVGQAAIAGGLGVDWLAGAVFNVPTFADAYRLAARDAAARLDHAARVERAA
jgi:NAD(P) transhydrogenase